MESVRPESSAVRDHAADADPGAQNQPDHEVRCGVLTPRAKPPTHPTFLVIDTIIPPGFPVLSRSAEHEERDLP